MPWYVLYTKSRNEKKLTQLLSEKGFDVYCPLQETVKQWSDRKKKVQEPIFKSYIFVHLKNYAAQQVEVLQTNGAVRFLWWANKPGIVRDNEINAIKDFINEYKGSVITVEFNNGEQVMIKEGLLKDQIGKVIEIRTNKALLFLQSLGCNMIAEVPLQSLQKN